MYSIAARFNKILFFGILNLAVLCVLNHLSGIFLLKGKDVQVTFRMKDGHPQYHFYRLDTRKYGAYWDNFQGVFDFTFEGVQSLNNWNLKQLFFYFEIVWEGKNGRR